MITEENHGMRMSIEALLENFLIQRKHDTELFREIISHEKTIRKYLMTNFGYQLKLDSEVAKVEKIPYFSRDWMGIQHFKDELDFIFLMAVFASLETKTFEDGFLLSNLIEDIKKFLLDIYEIDWKVRHQRESLARALLYAQEVELIKVRDGDLTDFEKSEEGEVLYESTPLIRYQFRNFSKRIEDFQGAIDMLLDDLDIENPRHTLFRKLYFEPVVFFHELTNEELEYLNDIYNYDELKEQIEGYTFYELERMYQGIMLVHPERKLNLHQHPSRKHESYIVAQVAYMLVNQLKNMDEKPFNLLELKNSDFEQLLQDTRNHFQLGWSSKMRETTFAKFKQIVVNYMVGWKLATYDDYTMYITIYPSFIRTIGEYEAELRDYIDSENMRRKTQNGNRV
jgi:uncharacterized protein (TIGR02678 family)